MYKRVSAGQKTSSKTSVHIGLVYMHEKHIVHWGLVGMMESVTTRADIQPADQESIYPPKMSHGFIFGKVQSVRASVSRKPGAQYMTIVPRAECSSGMAVELPGGYCPGGVISFKVNEIGGFSGGITHSALKLLPFSPSETQRCKASAQRRCIVTATADL